MNVTFPLYKQQRGWTSLNPALFNYNRNVWEINHSLCYEWHHLFFLVTSNPKWGIVLFLLQVIYWITLCVTAKEKFLTFLLSINSDLSSGIFPSLRLENQSKWWRFNCMCHTMTPAANIQMCLITILSLFIQLKVETELGVGTVQRMTVRVNQPYLQSSSSQYMLERKKHTHTHWAHPFPPTLHLVDHIWCLGDTVTFSPTSLWIPSLASASENSATILYSITQHVWNSWLNLHYLHAFPRLMLCNHIHTLLHFLCTTSPKHTSLIWKPHCKANMQTHGLRKGGNPLDIWAHTHIYM